MPTRRYKFIEASLLLAGLGMAIRLLAEQPSTDDQKRIAAGKDVYEITCLSCHQPNGLGQESLAPPLVGSPWITNSVERLVRIALHGMRGPIKVKDRVYEFPADMPPLGVLEDDQIAAVLSYVRQAWGHHATPITSAVVKKIRDANVNRVEPWTEPELLKIHESK